MGSGSVDKAAIGWTIAIVIIGAGVAVAGIGYDSDDKMMKDKEMMEDKSSGMSDYQTSQMERMMEQDKMDKEMSTMEMMMEEDRMSSGMMDEEMSDMEKMMMEDKMSFEMMMDDTMSDMEKMMMEDKMSSEMMMDDTMSSEMMMDDAMMSMTVSMPMGTSVPGCEETSECFIPYEASVSVGGSVTWINDDTAAHTVTSGSPASGPDGNFDSGIIPSSGSFTAEFDDSGSFDYFCLVHPWMAGVVSVN